MRSSRRCAHRRALWAVDAALRTDPYRRNGNRYPSSPFLGVAARGGAVGIPSGTAQYDSAAAVLRCCSASRRRLGCSRRQCRAMPSSCRSGRPSAAAARPRPRLPFPRQAALRPQPHHICAGTGRRCLHCGALASARRRYLGGVCGSCPSSMRSSRRCAPSAGRSTSSGNGRSYP